MQIKMRAYRSSGVAASKLALKLGARWRGTSVFLEFLSLG